MTRSAENPKSHELPAATTQQLADVISAELDGISLQHSVAHKWSAGAEIRFVEGIARFGSVRAFAAALERADADAEWSAGSGWTFREVDPDA